MIVVCCYSGIIRGTIKEINSYLQEEKYKFNNLHFFPRLRTKEEKISSARELITFSTSGKAGLRSNTVAVENIVPILVALSNSTINPEAFVSRSPSPIYNKLMH
jgi:hypothetical protein